MRYGDAPQRIYLCLVCAEFCKTTPVEAFKSGDIPHVDPDAYLVLEGRMALYVLKAGVRPVAVQLGIAEEVL